MKKLLLFVSMLSLSGMSFGQTVLNENFDGTTFPPTGWTVESTNESTWIRTTASIEGAGSAAVLWYGADGTTAAGDQDEKLVSPAFSLVGLNSATLSFDVSAGYEYMVDPNPNGDIISEVSTDGGATWQYLWQEEDEGTYADYDVLRIFLDLSPYLGQTNVKVRFHYVANDADTVKIDNVRVSTCASIDTDQLALTTLVDNSFTLSWAGTSASYDIEYGDVGFTQGSGTSVNTAAATYTFSGLTAGTGYAVYIRANCGGTSTSVWDGPYNIYTTLSPAATPTYDYGFENTVTFPSVGWLALRVTANTGALWAFAATDAATAGFSPQAGTKFVVAGANAGVSNTWLFSRGINMVAGGQYAIKYYVKKITGAGTGGTNTLAVKLGNAKTVAAMTTNISTAATVTSTTWTLKTVNYTPTTSGVYYVGFNYTSPAQTSAAFGWAAIDSFNVTAPLGVEDNSLKTKFDIYPNPASDLLSIANFEGIRINGVTMTDLNGRVVKRNAYSAVEDVEVNVSDLASGVYLLNIETDLGSVTKKIMKK